MEYKMSGAVIKINAAETKGNLTFRTFVIDTEGEYPQFIKFQVVQTMCPILDQIKLGQEITLHFSIRGREYNGDYFNNLNCYKIEGYNVTRQGFTPAPATSEEQASTGTEPADGTTPVAPDSDLPF